MISTIILSVSASHIIIVAIVLLLLFGGKKIPELMRGMGTGIKEFKDAVKEDDKATDIPPSNSGNEPNNRTDIK